jgi:AraC-like DNA-binding protein
MAAVACLSKYHFLRLFKSTYGITPMEYVSRRRIERAQDLLRATNLTVTEVGMAVGFSSLGSFSPPADRLWDSEDLGAFLGCAQFIAAPFLRMRSLSVVTRRLRFVDPSAVEE